MKTELKAATRLTANNTQYLESLGEQLAKLGANVHGVAKFGPDVALMVYPKGTPIVKLLAKLGWKQDDSKSNPPLDRWLVRADGSWPLQMYWKGATYIVIRN